MDNHISVKLSYIRFGIFYKISSDYMDIRVSGLTDILVSFMKTNPCREYLI